jgi:predicted nucleotidyltransferase
MITTKDQDELFRLVAEYLGKNISCIAIGGTAMMFLGYKTATKDIDLVFAAEEDRDTFVKAILKLGYREREIGDIYDGKRKKHAHKPRMYTRGEERFDLFVGNVFGMSIDFTQSAIVERRDYLGTHELTVSLLAKEDLILLKAVTRRERDHEDIETIIHAERFIDWDSIINKAIDQRKNNPWIIIDLEETMQELKDITAIPLPLFERLYAAQERG